MQVLHLKAQHADGHLLLALLAELLGAVSRVALSLEHQVLISIVCLLLPQLPRPAVPVVALVLAVVPVVVLVSAVVPVVVPVSAALTGEEWGGWINRDSGEQGTNKRQSSLGLRPVVEFTRLFIMN